MANNAFWVCVRNLLSLQNYCILFWEYAVFYAVILDIVNILSLLILGCQINDITIWLVLLYCKSLII